MTDIKPSDTPTKDAPALVSLNMLKSMYVIPQGITSKHYNNSLVNVVSVGATEYSVPCELSIRLYTFSELLELWDKLDPLVRCNNVWQLVVPSDKGIGGEWRQLTPEAVVRGDGTVYMFSKYKPHWHPVHNGMWNYMCNGLV